MISLTRSAEEVDHYETPSTQDELWAYGHTSTQQPITYYILPFYQLHAGRNSLFVFDITTNACQCIIYGATLCSDLVPK